MLAENALTTIERLKLVMGLECNSDPQTDDLLELMINKASAWIERQVGRHLGQHSYVQFFESDGRRELITDEYPITDVSYIKSGGVLMSKESYDYISQGSMGIISLNGKSAVSAYRGGLSYDILGFNKNTEVSYSAGYVLPKDATDKKPQTLPADIEGIVWDMVSHDYSAYQGGAQGISSLSLGDLSMSFDKTKTAEWTQIVNTYKRY